MEPSPGTVKLREGLFTALWYYPDWTEESAEQTWCRHSGQEGECGVCAVVMRPELWSIYFITGASGRVNHVATIGIYQIIGPKYPDFATFIFALIVMWIKLENCRAIVHWLYNRIHNNSQHSSPEVGYIGTGHHATRLSRFACIQ